MATLDSVLSPGISEEVDPTFRAGRVSLRPLEYQTIQGKILGHYSAVATNTASAFAAASNQAAFRWGDPTNFCVIQRVWAAVNVVTAVTAQATGPLQLFIARQYSARDATAATSVAFTASGTNRLRGIMSGSLIGVNGNFDVGNVAAGVTGGTKVVDTNPIGFIPLSGLVTIGTSVSGDLYKWDKLGGHPIVLAANEGLLVQNTTLLATGTVSLTIGIEWAEVAAF